MYVEVGHTDGPVCMHKQRDMNDLQAISYTIHTYIHVQVSTVIPFSPHKPSFLQLYHGIPGLHHLAFQRGVHQVKVHIGHTKSVRKDGSHVTMVITQASNLNRHGCICFDLNLFLLWL